MGSDVDPTPVVTFKSLYFQPLKVLLRYHVDKQDKIIFVVTVLLRFIIHFHRLEHCQSQ